ncbi:MAG: hypothetical protein RL226_771 [Bacteroidota bacterium]
MKAFLRFLAALNAWLFVFSFGSMAQVERFIGNETMTYEELITAYQELDKKYEEATLLEVGQSDVGLPIHVLLIDGEGAKSPETIRADKPVWMINNGIHPGEPCGVDASYRFARFLLEGRLEGISIDSISIAIIPMYNVGGALNRGCCSRANQNGPLAYGFRGNARNLDLNRDFVKCDAQNTAAFIAAFQRLQPDVLVDTHTSNGADYQYTMTLITTQPDKLGGALGDYVRNVFDPNLHHAMDQKGWKMSPYVNTHGTTPEEGIVGFLETPRYCTGYAALFGTIGFTTEAHMLKPFEDRVESTFAFLCSMGEFLSARGRDVHAQRLKWMQELQLASSLPVRWILDDSRVDTLTFDGYRASHPPSEVTGAPRLKYNRAEPFSCQITYKNSYVSDRQVVVPEFYIIPQAWREVIALLELNGVQLERFPGPKQLDVETYVLDEVKFGTRPYEGHFLHTLNGWHLEQRTVQIQKGDVLVKTNQPAKRFIVEILEPMADDALFRWNYFDSVLQQKEWYSDYVFEDTAADMLKEQPDLKRRFEEKKANDSAFATNPEAQLYWLYTQSDHFEPSVNRYPIFRYK